MAYSTDLFHLIHSMTKSEKRYFKLFSSFQSGSKVYIALFNAISKQEEYDEEKLKKQLNISAFPTVKTYLYNLILRCLRSQQLNQNISLQLKDMIKDVEILYQKGLYQQCSRVLTKARKVAKQYEKHVHLLELCQFEHLLTSLNLDSADRKALIKSGYKEVTDTLAAYSELSDYRNKILIIADFLHSEGRRIKNTGMDELYRSLENVLAKKTDTFSSYKAGILFYNIRELYQSANHEYEKALETSKKHVKHMESNPFLLNQEINNYLGALNNLMNMQQSLGLYEDLKENLDKLKSLDLPSETEHIRAIEYALPKEIVYYVNTNRLDKGLERIPYIEKQLAKYKDKMGKPFLFSLYANVVELYINCDLFRKGLQWNNKILNSADIETYKDYYSNSRLCEIIIHYELDNLEKVESLIKSYQLMLMKNNTTLQYENCILRFLKNLINQEENRELLKSFKSLRDELLKLSKDRYEKEAFHFFDLIPWLDKKIRKYSEKK
ncbi:MAG TPA: hypothetical protein VLB84_15290 [Bacteroidia bacterium]|nr:hypothetical protein [Bacteroidia bacterium]